MIYSLYILRLKRPNGRCSCGQKGRFSLRLSHLLPSAWKPRCGANVGKWCGQAICLALKLDANMLDNRGLIRRGLGWTQEDRASLKEVLRLMGRTTYH